MIVFDLACKNGHEFEAWFKDSTNFEEQKKQGLLKCPICGCSTVKKILSPVKLKKIVAGDHPVPRDIVISAIRGIYDNIVKNSEDVGFRFTSEALKMHYGVKEQKNIRGVATEEEEKILKGEGVEFFRIPVPEKKGKKDS